MTKDAAIKELEFGKRMLPFRDWTAVLINGEWEVCDSMRRAKGLMRKAKITSAEMLTTSTVKKRRR